MTRAFALAALAIVLALSVSPPAGAQSDQDTSSTGECFPWQELRNGVCVSKPNPAPIPPPAPLAADPCSGGTRNLSAQCPCPASMHPDAASGKCVADATAVAPPTKPVICSGGTIANGECQCPAGFTVMPAGGGAAANGGTCVKMHAENCLGGALTVSGACLCTSQVVMDGLTYDLELHDRKCVPKRCPVETVFEGGKCIPSSAAAAAPAPEAKTNAASPGKPAAEGADHRHGCPHGTVRVGAGCGAARRHSSDGTGVGPNELQRYNRAYQRPRYSSAAPGNWALKLLATGSLSYRRTRHCGTNRASTPCVRI